MQRILIVGPGGAGKSTLARSLGATLGLPVIHLDREYWRPGWQPTPTAEWHRRVDELIAGRAWIIDGNYSGSFASRLRAADTVIFLGLPRRVYLGRVVRRWLRHRGRPRPDMAEGCPERLDWKFLQWLWTYERHSRPRIVEQLRTAGPGVVVRTLSSAREVERFVAGLTPHSPQ
ncbi:MAG: AAA family ATPase [Gemmatimonadota bacterium]